ncbi:homeobox-leucine zipper protein HDG11 [Tanacetum coccineum]
MSLSRTYTGLQTVACCFTHASSRNFTVLRTFLHIDQGTWVVSEISLDITPYNCRQLSSGCLIECITEDESKVTWVEHREVDKSLPNQISGFAFGAEQRMAA